MEIIWRDMHPPVSIESPLHVYAVTVPIPRVTFINIYASSRRNGPISETPNRRASSRLTSHVRRNQLRPKQTGPFRKQN